MANCELKYKSIIIALALARYVSIRLSWGNGVWVFKQMLVAEGVRQVVPYLWDVGRKGMKETVAGCKMCLKGQKLQNPIRRPQFWLWFVSLPWRLAPTVCVILRTAPVTIPAARHLNPWSWYSFILHCGNGLIREPSVVWKWCRRN